jgi:hypothetical protein
MSRVVVLAAAGLTAPAAVGQTGVPVNDDLMPPLPTVANQAYDPTPDPDAGFAAGRFYFTAVVCNEDNLGAGDQGVGLESRTAQLTGNNVVLNRIPGGAPGDPAGAGSIVDFPARGAYADMSLEVGECVDVDYVIGLDTVSNFFFFVDFWRDPLGQATVPATPVATQGVVDVCGGRGEIDVYTATFTRDTYAVTVSPEATPTVRITAIEPEPISYTYTPIIGDPRVSPPPVGCGETFNTAYAQYDANAMPEALTIYYDCTCP